MEYGFRRGPLYDFLRRQGPLVLFALPVAASTVVDFASHFVGEFLILEYLLQMPAVHTSPALLYCLALLDVVLILLSAAFLRPFFRANKERNAGRDSIALHVAARTRMYNFPSFLIGLIWSSWLAGTLIYVVLMPEAPRLPFLAGGIFSTIVTAMMSFYTADVLNRQILIPYWFPDGAVRVSFRFRSPSLFIRFLDTFLVSCVFPSLSVAGLIFVVMKHGAHDSGEIERLLNASLVMCGIYWAFAFFLTLLNAVTFTQPLEAMARAATDFSEERFDSRVAVQSDDVLGRLQTAVNRMGSEMHDKRLIKTLFGHYVSPAIRDLILEGRVNTDGDRIEAVILFSDIRGFTALSESRPPEKVIQLLNLHFSRVVDTVSANYGFVDKFIGDAVMAVFDAEFCSGMHRLCAMKAAADILSGLQITNREIESLGFEPISIGVGMACGDVIRGNVGSQSRRELTVIGDTVNTASRLESATRQVGVPVLVTANSYDETCRSVESLHIEHRLDLQLRGKEEAVSVIGLDLRQLPAA